MTNVLNNIIANQPIKPAKQAPLPAFTFNAEGKIKPLDDKAKLLPSRIFGSPIEYVKDLKQDVVNIGRAATGKANDHELGRINDVAMKLGSLGLAAYLFAKNPLKLSKAMEFVGFGTFFASMALWPKLAIQAPIKARTGVDIHQKYVDSQGRKKMLHQDPQYDLTDLYSREDLDKMGKKLGVSENLPDRDSFIKQRAKKTATQGNTLWMMTAGIATPVMSALACNRLEKPINNAIEAFDLKTSQKALETGKTGFFQKIKQSMADKAFSKFLAKNADKTVDEKMAGKIASYMGLNLNSASMQSAVASEIAGMTKAVTIDENFVRNALKGQVDDAIIASVVGTDAFKLAAQEGSLKNIATLLSQSAVEGKVAQQKLSGKLLATLGKAQKSGAKPTVGDVTEKIKGLYGSLSGLTSDKQILDRFVSARVGDKSGTYIANQWSRVCDGFIKSLGLNGKELKALADGDMSILSKKLAAISADDEAYNKVVSKLMKLIGDYEAKTGQSFIETVQARSAQMSSAASEALSAGGFAEVAKKVSTEATKGTLKNVVDGAARERVAGAQSSFYRLLQSLDLFKRIGSSNAESKLAQMLKDAGKVADDAAVEKLIDAFRGIALSATATENIKKLKEVGIDLAEEEYKSIVKTLSPDLRFQLSSVLKKAGKPCNGTAVDKLLKACKDMVLNATTTDYVEKLKSAGFELSEKEYKAVMNVLFGEKAGSTLKASLGGGEQASAMLRGFGAYKSEFMSKVANWQNGMTPELSRCVVDATTKGANAIERNNLAGKPVSELVRDVAKQTYNSNKWLKIFGGTMIALTAVTLVAGLAIGRKSKIEKQLEQEGKQVNG